MSARWQVLGPDLVLKSQGNEFLRRYRLLQTPWFSLFVHRMLDRDPGYDLHDHPWWFWSVVLKGGYTEEIAPVRQQGAATTRRWSRWSAHTVRLDECHRITAISRKPTWTFVVTGPTPRRWGFFVDGQWVDYEEYDYSRRLVAR